jgi:acyl-CoA thioesterase-1
VAFRSTRWYAFLFAFSLVLSACGPASLSAPSHSSVASRESSSAPRVAQPRPGTYVAMGASETYGVGAVPQSKAYAYLVAHMLGARHFRDLGIPGATLNAAYDRELTVALAARPVLTTVFFGVNDLRAQISRQAFLHDLNDLVATLHQARSRVLVVGLPNLNLLPAARAYGVDLRPIVISWNNGMRAIARKYGADFLDLNAFSVEISHHPHYISGDGLHPSNAGYARLAQVVVSSVRTHHLWSGR